MGEVSVRIRRVPPRLLRRRYEVEIREGTNVPMRKVTSSPVRLMDSHLGVGDAWAYINAADEAWAGGIGPWVEYPPGGSPK